VLAEGILELIHPVRWTSQLGDRVSFGNSGLVDFLSFSTFFTSASLPHKSSIGAKVFVVYYIRSVTRIVMLSSPYASAR
jgi:hypothetical protein